MTALLASLLVTLGLLVLALRGLRALARTPSRGPVALEVLQRVAAGPKHAVALVRAGDRLLVVGLGETSVQLLTELAPDASPDPVPAPAPSGNPGALPTWLQTGARFLRRGALAGALVLIPALLPAQVVESPPPSARPDRTVIPGPTAPAVSLPTGPEVRIAIGQDDGGLRLDGPVGLVVFLGALTLLPALMMMATSFTRIVIVLHFLRSALGTPTTPPTQLLVAVAVLLSGVVMQPVLTEMNSTALQPYLEGRLPQAEAYHAGIQPLRQFMLANTRETDLGSFAELTGADTVATVEEIPTMTVMSAFVTSELRTAFQMGFVIFLPFVVIDLIVASVLMSMGMFMLPPQMVSLPFKLLLFVLADGWTLIVRNLVTSFQG